ncbi:MAG: hypothetical protein H6624_07565 [Bdellovibrionaceae bacterium]|nr:hypothetical protein [Bdellovibrionales bacterium]MCB9084187.1 hypothetical protein [Pseudobdellovibrionaceae bacterium]
MTRYFWLLLTFLFCALSFATDDAELVVKLGQGRASVSSYGFEIPENWQRKLETDLMTDRDLADRLISSATTEVRLSGPALDGVESKLSSTPEAAIEEIMTMIRLQVLGTSGRSSQRGGGTELGNENRRVVVGGRFELKEGESLEELVILGGQAEIRGKVARLSVMGGRVHLYPSSEVTEDLTNVGGQVKVEPGAKIQGEPYEVSTPFDDSFRFFFESHDTWDPTEYFKSATWLWGFRLFKLFGILIVTLILVQLAPDFFADAKRNLQDSAVACGLWGLLYAITYIPVAIVLTITLLGITLLPVQFFFSLYLVTIGCAATMVFLIGRARFAQGKHLLAQVGLAVVVFEVIGWIPVAGSVWHVLVSLVGLGATFQVIWRRIWKKKSQSMGHSHPVGPEGDKI